MSKRGNFAVPTGWSGPDRRFGEVIKENLDILSGNRGDPLDRAITARDLIDSGLAALPSGRSSFSGASNGLIPTHDSYEQLGIPPAPTNLQANGAFENIFLTWDLKEYKGHAFTQIYRHTSDDIANATFLGQLSGYTGVYSDQVGESATYYYWVRAVNTNGEVGAFNSSTGTTGQTAADVTFLLNKLSNAITSSELATSLATPINDIPGIKTDVQNLEGQYSVKIDNNGHVAGFGLSNTAVDGTPTSAFIVRADKFAVIDPADTSNNLTNSPSSDVVPFFIDSGDTYIKSAMIKDASITNAKIGSLSADKITTGTLNAARIGANSIEASKLQINSNVFAENNNGELILQTGSNATTGVKFENLSFDAVGVIGLAATNGYVASTNQPTVTYAQYTSGSPYSLYFTNTLPLILSLDIPASSLKESGEYFIDFGASVIGSVPSSPNYSIESAIVMDIFKKDPSSSIYTAIHQSFGSTHTEGASVLSLTDIFSFKSTTLDHTKDYRFRIFGYLRNMSSNSNGQMGFSDGFIRVLRLHKST